MIQRISRIYPFRLIAALSVIVWGIAPAHAQIATVAATQRIVETRVGETTAWQKAGKGTSLDVGGRLRTGKRSKADLKFTDGSLLRLGQLSSVEIRSTKGVALLGGQLLFSALHPGRVLAGTGAAEIKGSVGIVTLMADGSAEFSLFSGAMDVVTEKQTVNLPPGFWVTARPDGTLSDIKVAPPLRFSFGSFLPDLTQEPTNSPFVGSERDRRLRLSPERTTLDQYIPSRDLVENLPFQNSSEPRTSPTALPAAAIEANTVQGPRLLHSTLQAFQRASSPGADANANATVDALQHIEDTNAGLGRFSGYDYSIFGALSNNDTYAYGGRLHGFRTQGPFYFDLAVQPLRISSAEDGPRVTKDFSAVTSASLTYRHEMGDLQIGRQRFVSGPTQATLFGSLVRSGGREIMDAVRVEPNVGQGRRVELAYLHDAYVRNVPFRVGGAQHGFYGRGSIEKPYGNFGFNVLKYFNVPGDDTLGASVDFAVPVVKNEIELYGEAGRDPFRRGLTSAGLTFPGLHDRAEVDLFIEYARLRGHGSIAGPPSELTVRAYHRVSRNVYLIASASHFYGVNNWLTLGVSVGESSYRGTGSP